MNEIDTTCAPTESANSPGDSELLRQYVTENRQEAFAEIVRRHMSLVYHTALRRLGDTDQAEDVAQVVFTDLARKAPALRHRSVLAGWLHTSTRYAASNLRRRQARQQQRDHHSYVMQQITSNESLDWGQLRPVIDDALSSLGERDREAVLLRFFEGNSYAQIGSKLAVSEDSARVRVNRALEKLAGVLQQRGLTSTAATLAVALGVETAAAAPAGLAAHVTAAALGASALGGAGILAGFVMKVALAITATAAATAIGLSVHQAGALHRAQDQLSASDRQRAELSSRLAIAERQLTEAKKRSEEDSADTAKLLAAIASLRLAAAPTASVAPEEAITADSVQKRFKHAGELAREGHWEEALKEYLWCFDEGMVRISAFRGVRRSFLISELGDLAQKFPAARAAILDRIAAAQQKLNDNPADAEAPADFAALNHALGDDARTVEIFDHLAVDDPRRKALGSVYLYDLFVQNRRYPDAVQLRPYESSIMTLTTMEKSLAEHPVPQMTLVPLRRSMVAGGAKSVEALAGVGDLQHARELVAKLLAIDNSPESVATLQTHLARAGHPEVMAVPAAK